MSSSDAIASLESAYSPGQTRRFLLWCVGWFAAIGVGAGNPKVSCERRVGDFDPRDFTSDFDIGSASCSFEAGATKLTVTTLPSLGVSISRRNPNYGSSSAMNQEHSGGRQ